MNDPSDDQDLWAHYARGVKKLGEKETEAPKATKPKAKVKEKPPAPARAQEATPEEEPCTLSSLLQEERLSVAPLVAREPEKKEVLAAVAIVPPAPTPAPWKKEPLDLRIERNMSMGDVMIEARIDLHGLAEQAAYEAFRDFIEAQHKRSRRMLLVITGKGADGASVLRANLPRWCDAPPFDALVLAVRTAAPHHGGDGAYYVLLRKRG